MLERGEAIGLLVVLAVLLAGTFYVGRRTPSFTFVFAPVELALAGWVASTTSWDEPGDEPPPRRGPRGGPPNRPRGGGGSRVREPRRPRPSSGAGTATRDP